MRPPVSNTDMKKDAMPKYSAAALFLLTACVALGTFLRVGLGHAAVRLASRTLAYIPWRYWTDFNYEPMGPLPPELDWFVQLRLLSAILVLSSGACALVRLLPDRWSIRGFRWRSAIGP